MFGPFCCCGAAPWRGSCCTWSFQQVWVLQGGFQARLCACAWWSRCVCMCGWGVLGNAVRRWVWAGGHRSRPACQAVQEMQQWGKAGGFTLLCWWLAITGACASHLPKHMHHNMDPVHHIYCTVCNTFTGAGASQHLCVHVCMQVLIIGICGHITGAVAYNKCHSIFDYEARQAHSEDKNRQRFVTRNKKTPLCKCPDTFLCVQHAQFHHPNERPLHWHN